MPTLALELRGHSKPVHAFDLGEHALCPRSISQAEFYLLQPVVSMSMTDTPEKMPLWTKNMTVGHQTESKIMNSMHISP